MEKANRSALGALALLSVGALGCATDIDGAAPYGNDEFGLGGETVHEAELSASRGGSTVETVHRGYTGSGYVDFGAGGSFVEWRDVSVPAGDVTIRFRYANGGASDRTSVVRIGGREVGRLTFASTGGWDRWATIPLRVTLGSAADTVRLVSVGDGPNVDHLLVPEARLYEAEARSDARDCTTESSHAGFTGTGYADFGGEGSWIEWADVRGRAGESYVLTFRYANGSSSSRSLRVLVDGVAAGSLPFVSTGSWASWSTTALTVRLRSASSRIRLEATGSQGGPNVDHLAVGSYITADAGMPMPMGDAGVPAAEGITVVGTSSVWDSDGARVAIDRPSASRAGDLLVLVLHRTDDELPLSVRGWTRVAECLKRDNGYDCSTEADCERWTDDSYCAWFGDEGREARDLAQSVFYRVVGSSEPRSYTFEIDRTGGGHPGWALLTALRGADTRDPVRRWAAEGCDGDVRSVFPSVYGERGDMVLLSQSFDDAIAESRFLPPAGTTLLGYVGQSDEAGFLFGGTLSRTGETGRMTTRGSGGPDCKDALVALTIRPR